MKRISSLLLLFCLPLMGSAFAADIVIEETKTGNQTITNVYVTAENSDASINNAIMISSSIIIGFVGFSSIFQFQNHGFSEEQRKMVYMICGVIITISTLHLFAILFAHHNMIEEILDGHYYSITIVITAIGFGLIIIAIFTQINWRKSIKTDKRNMADNYSDKLNETREEQNPKDK